MKCLRCSGRLMVEIDEWFCLNCGWRQMASTEWERGLAKYKPKPVMGEYRPNRVWLGPGCFKTERGDVVE